MDDYTLDACALIALINKEPEADMVDDLIQRAVAGEAALNMSIINLTEVHYGYLHERGAEEAERILNRILSYPIRVISVITEPVFRKAAFFKASYSISLADAYACATAWWTHSTLVTKDHEIRPVEQREKLSVRWIK
jgi:predicted nucleic acid-binding protein